MDNLWCLTYLWCIVVGIDECSTDHNCTQNQQCVNILGTFICECVSGYELLNGTCESNEKSNTAK